MEPQEPKDFLDFFHQAASDHGKKVSAKPVIEHNEQVKGKILDILKKIKGNQKEMEALQQTNPKAYQSMLAMTQAMVQMAKQYMVQPEEGVQKDELKPILKFGPPIVNYGSYDTTVDFDDSGLEKNLIYPHRLNIPSGTTKQGAAPIPRAGETGVVSQDEPNKDGQAGKKRHNRQVRSGLTTNPENGMPISVKEVPRQENDGAKPPKG